MSNGRRPVRISHDKATQTITVTLPMAPGKKFPAIWRLCLRPNVLDVEVIREREFVGFVLTLNATVLTECYLQLNRILARSIVKSIIYGPKSERSIQISAHALAATVKALRQIAKHPQSHCIAPVASEPVPVIPGAISPTVARSRKVEQILRELADNTTGLIPAHKLPRPPRKASH